MKKILVLLLVSMMLACNLNPNDLSITVKKTAERYELKAVYPKYKAKQLDHYLKSAFKGDSVQFDQNVETGKEMVLSNGVTFYVRSNPGKLEMEMLKDKNTTLGYQYFDAVVDGIKAVLK